MRKKVVLSFLLSLTFISFFFVNTHPTSQPQVANFWITNLPEFGQIADRKTISVIVTCVEGSGSGQVKFSVKPSDIPISFTPMVGTPPMSEGDSYTIDFQVVNLGTAVNRDFSITVDVNNSLGSITDTKTTNGTILVKGNYDETKEPTSNLDDETNGDLPHIIIISVLAAVILLIVVIIGLSRRKIRNQ